MNLISKTTASLLILGSALAFATAAQAVTFNYSNTAGSKIEFDGASNFSFSGPTNNFHVTSGTANGLLGEITGTYTIGAVVTVGPTSSAPVSGVGTFVIHDGAFDLAGVLSWSSISQTGTGNSLNTFGSVNLSNITYSGSNVDLVALANNTTAYNVLTFQFVPAVSLDTLKSSANSTSFSGTVTSNVPDSGTSVLLLGAALSGLALIRRKFFV